MMPTIQTCLSSETVPRLNGPWRKMPLWLHGHAELLDGRPVCVVVGSRACSQTAQDAAFSLAQKLALAGVVVMSGGALGVDAAAHRGALSVDGLTCAVLGTGIGECYPARHRELQQQIATRGLLLSMFPPGEPPRRQHFPTRNKLMVALADTVVVVEARARSGSLVTARYAVESGRRLCAFGGSVGTELLATAGIPLFQTVEQTLTWVLENRAVPSAACADGFWSAPTVDAGEATRAAQEKTAIESDFPVSAPAGDVLGVLMDCKDADVGELCARTGLNPADCAAALVELELAQRCTRLAGGRYIVHAPLS